MKFTIDQKWIVYWEVKFYLFVFLNKKIISCGKLTSKENHKKTYYKNINISL